MDHSVPSRLRGRIDWHCKPSHVIKLSSQPLHPSPQVRMHAFKLLSSLHPIPHLNPLHLISICCTKPTPFKFESASHRTIPHLIASPMYLPLMRNKCLNISRGKDVAHLTRTCRRSSYPLSSRPSNHLASSHPFHIHVKSTAHPIKYPRPQSSSKTNLNCRRRCNQCSDAQDIALHRTPINEHVMT